MPKSKASEAAAQELEALKLGMENVNIKTYEINQKLIGIEGKFSSLTDQMGRFALMLSERFGCAATMEEDRRRAAAVVATAAATVAPAAPNASATAAQGAGPAKQIPEETRGPRGHSQPPHWRRRPDMDQHRQYLMAIERQDKGQKQPDYVDVDTYYDQHLREEEQHPPYNPNPYTYPEQYPQWNQNQNHHANHTYNYPIHPEPYYSSTIDATACNKAQVPCEMRRSYGFNNLISRSVFLADGAERRYYALPEDYPLESSAVVEKVSVTPPVAEQAVGLAPILCSKANDIAVSESLYVHDVQPPTAVQDDPIGLKEMHVSAEEEKQQQDSENALINVQQLGAPRLNVLVIHERINEWDPGIHAIPSSTSDRDIFYCRVPSRLINHEVQFLWDPGAAAFLMTPLNDGSSNDPIGNEHVGRLVRSTGDFFQRKSMTRELFDVFVGTPEQQKFDTELIAVDVEVLDGCSNEPVHVFTNTPELQTYEEANHGSGQAPKNFIKPIFGSERSTVGVFSLATRQTPDTELCGKHVKPQVNNQQWNMQMTEARRNEWDPGIRQIIVDVPVVVNWSSSIGLTHAEIFSPHIYAATYIPNILVSLPLYMLWDPGDTNLRTLFTTPSDASITAFTPLFGFTPLSESKTMVKSARLILSSTSSAAAIFSASSSSLPFGGSFAVPEPVFTFYDDKPDGCSNEFVHVFTSTPEQFLKCVGKGPEAEQTIVYLNYLTDVQPKHSVEKAAVHVQQLRDHQSKVLVIHEKRKEWDPGASLPLMSSKAQHSSYALQPAIDATILAGSSATRFSGCKCLTFWVQNNSYALWKSEIGMPTYMSWDPGVLNIIDMMPDKYTVPNNAQFMQQTAELSFLSLTACIQYMTSNGNNSVLQDTSFFLQKAAHFSHGILSLMDVMMDKTAVPNQVHSGQTTCEQLTFIGQPVDLMKFWTWLLLQSSSWYSNPNAFLQVPYCYLPIVMDCLYLKPVKQLVCYTSMFNSNARCTSIAVTIRMRLVLCSGEIAQEGRVVAVGYRAFKLQLQMRYVWAFSLEKGRLVQWDPGIEIIFHELWWLSKGTGYVLKRLLAVKFGTQNYTYFSDIAASMCCPPANLIPPHRRKFAALPQFCHSILLSSVVCVWDPG